MERKEKTAVITGATSGIGEITAIALAKEGMTLVLPVRDMSKGEALKQEILKKTGNKNVEVIHCNLASFQSIREFASTFRKKYDKLHLLVNNAGTWEKKRMLSEDGIEMNFAVNHLAPFLLTNLLLEEIVAAAPSRIVNVSSTAHKQTTIKFNDIEGTKRWSFLRSYAQGKLGNILFTRKLAADLKDKGVTVNCLHPGVVNTRLFDKMPAVFRKLASLFMITPQNGAQTTIYLATSQEVKEITGEYFVKKKIARTSKHAGDMEVAEKLWEVSKTYCGI
ncbi:MAG: SDR family oxidoreductase [Bacteroidia bacterium]|nr:MAG: SDR family oxidoreductase [Bacteroidia bacterium]